jgi:glycerophosphoryl diester phosphodiesterase
VWIVGHRGASGHAPENTMAAFRRAVEMGASYIETDLHLTRDARIVAIHDSTLDRTTSGHGAVHAKSLEELRLLDAGAWFKSSNGESFSGEIIPTIDEILQFSRRHDIVFYLEIKSGGTWGIEHAVVGALREFGGTARIVILSFEPVVLESVHDLDSTMMTGYLCEYPAPDLIERAIQVGARQLAPRGDLVTPDLVSKAHLAGLQVVTWTINEPDRMRQLIATGVDGIMTDYPDRLVKVLKEKE